jgi:hypothetical protein
MRAEGGADARGMLPATALNRDAAGCGEILAWTI